METNSASAHIANSSIITTSAELAIDLPPDAKREADLDRRRTYFGQALIFFNVFGIPLSFGPYLEFYRNSTDAYETSRPNLAQICFMQAAQVLFLYLSVFPTGWLYQGKIRRTTLWTAGIGAVVCVGALPNLHQWWHFAIIHGLQGLYLGALATTSTLSLATHYKNNIPLASMVSVNAGFIGAMAYTTIAYSYLPNIDDWKRAQYINVALLGSTLFFAACLIKPNTTYKILAIRTPLLKRHYLRPSPAICFALGYNLLSFGLFILPTYVVLLIANPPSQTIRQTPMLGLLFTYAAAFCSASLVSSPYLRRGVGPVNIFVGAAVLAGACYICPGWMPWMIVTWPNTITFGICLGPIFVLHVKVLCIFVWDETMPYYVAAVLSGGGITASLGVMGTGLVVVQCGDGEEVGLRIAMTMGAGGMMAGGCLMAWARWGRSGKKFRIAI